MTSLNIIGDLMEQRRRKEEEEKAAREAEQTLAGRAAAAGLENTVRTQGSMDMPSFQETFRRGMSPAREILSNVMAGVSSKMLGTPFKPVRQRMFEEYERQEKLKQNEERMQNTLMIAQAADERARAAATQASADRQAATNVRAHLGIMKNAVDQGKLDVAKTLATIAEDRNLREEEKQALMLQIDADLKRAKIGTAASGSFEEAGQALRNQGDDPTSEGFVERQLELAGKIEALRKQGKFASRGPSPFTGTQIKDVQNAFGEMEYVRVGGAGGPVNATTGQPHTGPIRPFSDLEVKEIQNNFTAANEGRQIAAFVLQNPSAVRTTGHVWAQIAPNLTNLSGIQNPKELGVANLMGQALATRVRAFSGAQVTDRERQFFEKIAASPLDTPRNAVAKAFVASVIQDAAAIRSSLNINAETEDLFDFAVVMTDVLAIIDKADKAGKLSSIRLPSRKFLVEEAARAKGKTVIFDAAGRVRGVR